MFTNMPGFGWYIVAMAIGLFVVWAVELYRRKTHTVKSQSRGVSNEWVRIIEENVPIYRRMPVDLQEQFQTLTLRFIEHKKFVPCGDLAEISDEMKVTIAGNAVLLVMNRPLRYPFHHVYSVLVYPSGFFNSREEEGELLNGEAWPTGSVVVAWDQAKKTARDLRDGRNLVIHEFAHQLDMEDGVADGAPILDSHLHRTWARVLSTEFQKLQDAAERGRRTVIDQYGADDPAEFFAVATEAFFERGEKLLQKNPDLYEQLRLYYRLDPVRWMADPRRKSSPN